MRVLFVTNQAVALHHGGVRTQLLQTKAALEQLGATVTLFEMWKDWDASQYDLVHIFSANIATYHFARALRVRNIPFVVSPVFYTRRTNRIVRSVITADRLLNTFMRGLWTDYGLIAEMCGWANAVLPNTSEEFSLLTQAMDIPSSQVIITPNGVEERFAKAPAELFERQYGLKDFILYVGNIGPARKNVSQLLLALEKIEHPAVIIGSSDQSPTALQCLKRAKNNPRLLVVDQLSHDSMLLASAYAACKVFALPSLYETPGLAALEAGLAGANIVITPYGGTKDYFLDDADYVEPASTADIERGIRHALQKQRTPALAERIKNQYFWQKVGEKTKKVYELVLAGR